MIVGNVAELRRPDAIIIDESGYKQLWPGEPYRVGKIFEMNDRRARVVGVCKARHTFQTFPIVYTRYSQATQFAPQERKVMSFILANPQAGVSAEEVCQRIQSQTGLQALTTDQFAWKTIEYYMEKTGIPINFGITVLLGFIVGTAIAGQTFYLFTVENLKQFGALKAMGASNFKLLGMIMLQAAVVAFLGYSLGVGMAAIFGELTREVGPVSVLHALAGVGWHGRSRGAHLDSFQLVEYSQSDGAGTGHRLSRVSADASATTGASRGHMPRRDQELWFGRFDRQGLARRRPRRLPRRADVARRTERLRQDHALVRRRRHSRAHFSGEVNVLRHDLTRMSQRKKVRFRRQNIGFVFQQFNLLPALTAAENVSMPLILAGRPSPGEAAALELLGRMDMGNRAHALPSTIIGRTAAARGDRASAHPPPAAVGLRRADLGARCENRPHDHGGLARRGRRRRTGRDHRDSRQPRVRVWRQNRAWRTGTSSASKVRMEPAD